MFGMLTLSLYIVMLVDLSPVSEGVSSLKEISPCVRLSLAMDVEVLVEPKAFWERYVFRSSGEDVGFFPCSEHFVPEL